jgi:hypothetical protein
LNQGLQPPGKNGRDRLPSRLLAEPDGLFEGLQAGKTGQAFRDMRLELPQLAWIHLLIDVFRKSAEQLQAFAMIVGLTGHG